MIDYEALEKARQRFITVGRDCWRAYIETDEELGADELRASAGDCNCPYDKPYDPSDRHGFSNIDISIDEHLAWYERTGKEEMTLADGLDILTDRIIAEWPHAQR